MEILRNILEYLSIVMGVLVLVRITNDILQIYQQAHYHLSGYKKIFKDYYRFNKFKNKNYLFLAMIPLIFISDKIYGMILFVLIGSLFLVLKKREKKIVKLKFTTRIIRLYIGILIVNSLLATLILVKFNLKELLSAIIILILFENILVFISSCLMLPIEKGIYLFYKVKCQKKLKHIGCKKIAITGSYGKTSTKAILYSILKEEFITFRTEKSYNTLNGICLSVNENMSKNTEVAIFEFGASEKNDIKRLIDLVKPDYGIVTAIGEQHLETFKSLDNIINEKMLLASSTKKIVLNIDDENIKKESEKYKNKITVAINENADFKAQNIVYNREGLKFEVISRDENYSIVTKILGWHNIYNILCSIAMAKVFNVKKSSIEKGILMYDGEKNRLKLEYFHDELVLNDSYNSNKVGFRNALDTLKMFDSYKVLITPGIVEGGKLEEEINYSLAKYIKESCDMVILVKNKASSYIQKGLEELGYDNVAIVNSFNEGFDIYKGIKKEKILLIENDITDIYKI